MDMDIQNFKRKEKRQSDKRELYKQLPLGMKKAPIKSMEIVLYCMLLIKKEKNLEEMPCEWNKYQLMN